MEALFSFFNDYLSTMDAMIVLIFLALVFIYSFTIGKDDGVMMIIALYISAFPFFFLPNIGEWLQNVDPTLPMTVIGFVVLFIVTYLILRRNEFFASPMVPDKWEIGVFAFLFAGLFLTIIFQIGGDDFRSGLSYPVDLLFNGVEMVLAWTFAPIISWLVIKGD